MNRIKWILSLAAVTVLPASQMSCTELECGVGTIEEDGVCVPADNTIPEDTRCADGTEIDPTTQECVNTKTPTVCGPNTVEDVDPITGETICVGVGGGGCAGPIACAQPNGGKVSVCGRLFDTETGAQIEADGATGAICDPDNPTADGPCALNIEFFDPLAFAANPTGTPPLAFDVKEIDDCGRFRGINVTRPFNGFMAVASESAGSGLDVRLTGIAFPVEMNERRDDLRAHVTLASTDEKWRVSAGDPFSGQTFADVGVFLPIYSHGDTPVSGVVITAGGAIKPDDDYYFDDTDPTIRSSVDPGQSSTGVNGAGLLTNSSLAQHGGQGAEPAGCEWPAALAAAIPTVVFLNEKEAESSPGEPCPTE